MGERFTKIHERVIEGGLLLLLFFPLALGEYGPLLYPIGHDMFIWIMIEGMAVSLLILFAAKYWRAQLPRFSWIAIFFLLWWLATGLATLFSPQQSVSFWGSLMRNQGLLSFSHFAVLFFILLAFRQKKGGWEGIFAFAVSISIFVASLALWEKAAGSYRVLGTLGNPNLLAGYLILIIFISFALALQEKRVSWKICYETACILQTTALLFTLSRAAYLGTFVGFFVFFLLLPVSFQKIKIAGLLFLAGIAASAAFFQFTPHAKLVQAIAPNALNRFLRPVDAESVMLRSEAWHQGLGAIAARPIFGWGPDNFAIPFNASYRGTLEHTFETWFDRAHNIFLDVGATTGIGGLTAFLALLISIFFKNIRLRFSSQDGSAQLMGTAVCATIIGYATNGFFNFDTGVSLLYLTVLAAWTAGIPLIRENHSTSLSEPRPTRTGEQKMRNRRFILIGGTVFGTVLIFLAVGRIYTPILLANYNLNQAKDSVEQNRYARAFEYFEKGLERGTFVNPWIRIGYASALLKHADIEKFFNKEEALNELQKGLSLVEQNVRGQMPYSVWDYTTGGLIAAKLFELDQKQSSARLADFYFGEALKLSPSRPSLLAEWAKYYMTAGEFKKSKEKLFEAIRINSLYPESYWLLGLIETYESNPKGAQRYFDAAKERGMDLTTPERLLELARVYEKTKDVKNVETLYRKLIAKDPPNSLPYYLLLASAFHNLGETEKKHRLIAEINALELPETIKQRVEEFLKKIETGK